MTDLKIPTSISEAEANVEQLKTKTKTAWKKKAVHPNVVLPSGAVVSLKIPNIPALVQAGEIPNELVDIATASQASAADSIPPDALKKLSKLQDFLISTTVVEPAIDPEDVADLPAEDVPFISDICYRRRDMDAVGRNIAGLDTVEKYATFRDDTDRDEALLDA